MYHNEHLGPKLKSINNQLKKRLCKDGQYMQLTSTQMHILKYLCTHQDSVIYQKDILNEFDLSNATVSGIISRLEAKGFVFCAHSDSDSRYKQICITEKALGCHLAVCENIVQLEERLIDGFTKEEIQKLHEYLDRIQKNLNS